MSTAKSFPAPEKPALRARAEACANIALAKYWGKSERGGNHTAVPSLSMTLDSLRTRTEVEFLPGETRDVVSLNGAAAGSKESARVSELLDRIRRITGFSHGAQVTTVNDFPTAAGLASSASGFAALAVAAAHAAGLGMSAGALSSLARQSSASAARSLFAGFAELLAEADQAAPVASADHANLAMLVLVVEAGKKPMSSTLGMNHTKESSPYYPAWLSAAPALFADAKRALLRNDFDQLAEAMEQSTRLMHSTMLTARPPILYLRGTTIELMHEISARRSRGYTEAYTMDAGPNVKLLTYKDHVQSARNHYDGFPGVSQIITCYPGPGAAVLSAQGALSEAERDEEVS